MQLSCSLLFLPFDFLFLSLWACTTLRRFVSVNVPLLSTAGSKNQCPLWGISSTPFEAAAQTAAATSNSGGKSSGTFMASALSSSGLLMLSFGLLAAATTHTHTQFKLAAKNEAYTRKIITAAEQHRLTLQNSARCKAETKCAKCN